jgi:hypothetical protein
VRVHMPTKKARKGARVCACIWRNACTLSECTSKYMGDSLQESRNLERLGCGRFSTATPACSRRPSHTGEWVQSQPKRCARLVLALVSQIIANPCSDRAIWVKFFVGGVSRDIIVFLLSFPRVIDPRSAQFCYIWHGYAKMV